MYSEQTPQARPLAMTHRSGEHSSVSENSGNESQVGSSQ